MPKAVQNGSSAPEYLTDDGHGNIANVTGTGQTITCGVQYDPWGNPVGGQGVGNPCGTGTTSSDIFYRSARRDSNTGDYQFGFRTYDPTRAGFLSSDVYRSGTPEQNQGLMVDPLTIDRYNYVNGDPVNLVDFNGHKVCAQGDPNPDCDSYRPGTQYNAQQNGGKDQAYYDNQAAQQQKANDEAAARYKAWQQEQKGKRENNNSCSLNPLTWSNCAAQVWQNSRGQIFTSLGAAEEVTGDVFKYVKEQTYAARDEVTAEASALVDDLNAAKGTGLKRVWNFLTGKVNALDEQISVVERNASELASKLDARAVAFRAGGRALLVLGAVTAAVGQLSEDAGKHFSGWQEAARVGVAEATDFALPALAAAGAAALVGAAVISAPAWLPVVAAITVGVGVGLAIDKLGLKDQIFNATGLNRPAG